MSIRRVSSRFNKCYDFRTISLRVVKHQGHFTSTASSLNFCTKIINNILLMLLPPTKQEVNAFAHVRLSVCLLARLLRNTCMDLDEMLRVDKCRDMDELINF